MVGFKNFRGQTKKFPHVSMSDLMLKIKVGIHGNKGEAPRPWPRCSEESRVTGANTVKIYSISATRKHARHVLPTKELIFSPN